MIKVASYPFLLSMVFALALLRPIQNHAAENDVPQARYLLDLAGNNPGEAPQPSAFLDPKRLADWGYTGQVIDGQIEGVPTFDSISPDLLPTNSPERKWADDRAAALNAQIRAAHAAGMKCYGWTQVLVLPKAVVAKFKDQICDAKGRIDIHLPKTKELFAIELREIFQRLPELDGLIIRTGEIYLQDLPHHTASMNNAGLTQGGTTILNGPASHIDLLGVLRDEVCVKLNKPVFYRTWDFGNNFHVNPEYYLKVTNAIEPHANLMFSIKHQAGDFHQLTPFNPTIGIGKHRQIIEVQCQREAYGKGAHPYYIGEGVIDGWEDFAWLMKPGQTRGLRDAAKSPLYAGIWTWSRGGGWDGPYITNEFWCALNAYVIAKFARDPTRSEADIFAEYERSIGLQGDDVARFRELNQLSTKAVLRGQLTTLTPLGAKIDVWWARDDFLAAPDLNSFIEKGLIQKALDEKRLSVMMWNRIEEHAKQIHFSDEATKEFVVTSASYGRIKYAIIEQAWTILLLGKTGEKSGQYDKPRLAAAITAYDSLWQEWRDLKEQHPTCSTIYKDLAFRNKPGIGAAVNRYRTLAAQ